MLFWFCFWVDLVSIDQICFFFMRNKQLAADLRVNGLVRVTVNTPLVWVWLVLVKRMDTDSHSYSCQCERTLSVVVPHVLQLFTFSPWLHLIQLCLYMSGRRRRGSHNKIKQKDKSCRQLSGISMYLPRSITDHHGTYSARHRGMARLSWPGWLVSYPTQYECSSLWANSAMLR